MECTTQSELLTSFYDDELAPDQRVLVDQHVATCPKCQEALRRLRVLSVFAEKLPLVAPTSDLWRKIAEGTDSHRASKPCVSVWSRRCRWLTTAVGGLLAVGILIALIITFSHDHKQGGHRITDFTPYLSRFPGSPELAVEYFVDKYQGKPVDLSEAEKLIGYQPVVGESLAPEYTLRQSFLLDMPCCRCVCGCFQHQDGHIIHIFEHARDQAVSFGDNPVIVSSCHGRGCRLVQVDGLLAVNWTTPANRSLTVVGAKSIEEVSRVVESLDRTS
jgi:hypothetical protein